MSLLFPQGYAAQSGSHNHAKGVGLAVLVHTGIAALAIFGFTQAETISEVARPIMVRLVEAARPEEKPPVPLPPKPVPRAQPKVHKQPVLASTAPADSSSFVVPEQPVMPAPVLAPSPAPRQETMVEARFDADYLSNPKPPYPSASRRLGEAGTVYLRVHVGADGQAIKVELKTSCGFQRLDQSALQTVAQWRFVPAKRGSTHVASWVIVPIVFALS